MIGRAATALQAGDLDRFAALQRLTLTLAGRLDDKNARIQHHSELSPLAWHLGHTVCVEVHWLAEQVCGEKILSETENTVYFPENLTKPLRAERLPPLEALQFWAERHQAANLARWQTAPADHPLMKDGYLLHFLIQHYAQHLEIMHMILQCAALAGASGNAVEARPPLMATRPSNRWAAHPGGPVRCGDSDNPAPYDNEQPATDTDLAPFLISPHPVTNGEFLAFMESGGYADDRWWDEAGLHWRAQNQPEHPFHWRLGPNGWIAVSATGPEPLPAHAAVYGVNRFEAAAYARWVGARLPHEHEWESAFRAGLIQRTGEAWEWCDNAFFPYPGYRAYPYEGYSKPWFDGAHFTLKGGSPFTQPEIHRPGFRNFYGADKRHIFAGLRLARSAV
ncbi:MAG: SUMF1/EgtB/PvdO family nonheme iron enzyme [Pseudomonadota bacterium]|nr:SUMF1/EgtB/PvdO family nonheme iron enzyme [Pseudomonadota bacterium]